jgi:hypothetical protein
MVTDGGRMMIPDFFLEGSTLGSLTPLDLKLLASGTAKSNGTEQDYELPYSDKYVASKHCVFRNATSMVGIDNNPGSRR